MLERETAEKERLMRAALALARKGRTKVSPNPMVGAVIVKGDAIISSGFHKRAGGEHAEINAIRNAKVSLAGSTMYVNLEPCCHHGKTPPCTKAIIESGIERVVIGTIDPNPLVAGKGVRILREAGIDVETGILKGVCRKLNEVFFTNMEKGMPFVTLKLAATLDGKIADREGRSRWISSPQSRDEVHRLRAENDAVLVGYGTVRTDDPLLLPVSVRRHRKPARIVLNTWLDISMESKIVKTAREASVIIFASENAPAAKEARLRSAGVEVVRTGSNGDLLVLPEVMRKILRMGMTSILCEGGSLLSTSLVRESLVDRLVFFTSPALLCDPLAVPAFADLGLRGLDEMRRFRIVRIKKTGDDIMVTLEPLQVGISEGGACSQE